MRSPFVDIAPWLSRNVGPRCAFFGFPPRSLRHRFPPFFLAVPPHLAFAPPGTSWQCRLPV